MQSGAPVLLVPGAFGQDVAYWNVARYLLEREGHPTATVTFPRFTLADLTQSAATLADRVEKLRNEHGGDAVHLVAHSMGGLIARHYLQEAAPANAVRTLACLGVPHHGTWAGLTMPVLKGCRQVLPGSAFLMRLNDPARAKRDVPILNIWSRTDLMVVPTSNARLDFPHVTNRQLSLAGHWAMLVAPSVYRDVRNSFEVPAAGAFAASRHRAQGTDPALA